MICAAIELYCRTRTYVDPIFLFRVPAFAAINSHCAAHYANRIKACGRSHVLQRYGSCPKHCDHMPTSFFLTRKRAVFDGHIDTAIVEVEAICRCRGHCFSVQVNGVMTFCDAHLSISQLACDRRIRQQRHGAGIAILRRRDRGIKAIILSDNRAIRSGHLRHGIFHGIFRRIRRHCLIFLCRKRIHRYHGQYHRQ